MNQLGSYLDLTKSSKTQIPINQPPKSHQSKIETHDHASDYCCQYYIGYCAGIQNDLSAENENSYLTVKQKLLLFSHTA